ncbi:BZ3500_MvSof-1268-A1-R1_Chr4-1g06730 [Microbotryum saponariae]|uniref:BZ3500_MvSof-1268-A1-R1_Chr4-1g06730 protein n=1 Tax=Microbotryum saponariae TaxID=289078 RepID=A0A2X0MB23_9BASI|nr:BZ3500_MvSof-1268-A1-R1_Chr4-1g06730 [Microbotryum saponariae]SDA06395.1 BZ3501_MvSof-1269-A2-R1_Chr4-1g06440 [Microbotryum saponariae]
MLKCKEFTNVKCRCQDREYDKLYRQCVIKSGSNEGAPSPYLSQPGLVIDSFCVIECTVQQLPFVNEVENTTCASYKLSKTKKGGNGVLLPHANATAADEDNIESKDPRSSPSSTKKSTQSTSESPTSTRTKALLNTTHDIPSSSTAGSPSNVDIVYANLTKEVAEGTGMTFPNTTYTAPDTTSPSSSEMTNATSTTGPTTDPTSTNTTSTTPISSSSSEQSTNASLAEGTSLAGTIGRFSKSAGAGCLSTPTFEDSLAFALVAMTVYFQM